MRAAIKSLDSRPVWCSSKAPKRRTKRLQKIMSSARPTTLVTFDVDGTLIRASGADANKFHKDAFAHGFRHVYGIETTIDVISHHGSTDQLVTESVLKFHGYDDGEIWSKMPEHVRAMSEYAVNCDADAAHGLELLPGVLDLLQNLKSRDDVVVCLVTGNLEPIGWAKMERLEIAEYFTPPRFGGFGSDHTDRGELVRIAAERCMVNFPNADLGDRRFHFGDTPNDVKAAEVAGATAIGLLTGIFSRRELAESSRLESPIIFDDLSRTDDVLKAMGLAA